MPLPFEILNLILAEVPDRRTLLNAICSSPVFWTIFQSRRHSILTSVTLHETKLSNSDIILGTLKYLISTNAPDALALGQGVQQGFLVTNDWRARQVTIDLYTLYTTGGLGNEALAVWERLWQSQVDNLDLGPARHTTGTLQELYTQAGRGEEALAIWERLSQFQLDR